MSKPSLEPEELISRLSHRPPKMIRAMIRITDSLEFPAPTPADRPSSVGKLDRLPPEIIHMILGLLDVKSITRFAGLSHQGNRYTRSLRAYRDTAKYAPQALLALKGLGILGLHSVNDLYAELRTEQCATCAEYGAFLYLSTCDRCCWFCLAHHPSLRLLRPKPAKAYFALSEKHLRQLPIVHAIPGNGGIPAGLAPKRYRLVSVKAVKELGLTIHGSPGNLAHAMYRRCSFFGRRAGPIMIAGEYYQSTLADLDSPYSVYRKEGYFSLPCNYFGAASVPFPSLSERGKTEEGLWCIGCEFLVGEYLGQRLSPDTIAAHVPSGLHEGFILTILAEKERSKREFLDHVKHCHGAQRLLSMPRWDANIFAADTNI